MSQLNNPSATITQSYHGLRTDLHVIRRVTPADVLYRIAALTAAIFFLATVV